MRNLNINELSEVQGGGIASKWAFKIGEWLSNGYALYETGSKIELEPSSYGPVDPTGYNPMGDYNNSICTK